MSITPAEPVPVEPRWQAEHDHANNMGSDGYIDPDTGFFVMTKGYLERRGTCCSNNCRHCPYGVSLLESDATNDGAA